MSRIPSSTSASTSGAGGVAISGKPLSTVYTVLAIVATLFLVAAIVITVQKSLELFNYGLPLGDDYKAATEKTNADAKAIKGAEDTVKAQFDLLTGLAGHTEAEAGQPAAAPVVAPVVPAPVAPAPAVPSGSPATSAAPAA
jgi:hypothetical protein